MKTALVLSGGGAKGAFQAGALEVLHGHGIKYQSIAGVSVGALNGIMISAGRIDRLLKIWKIIQEEDIYSKRSVLSLGVHYLLYRIGLKSPPKSIYSNEPLLHLLREEFSNIELKTPIHIGRVNLQTGEYINQIDPEHASFALQVLASTAIPVIWEPVKLDNQLLVDGGIRNTTPLRDVIDDDPDKIIIITTSPLDEFNKEDGIKDIIEIAERSLSIMMNEIFIEDIKQCIRINSLVRQAKEKGTILKSIDGRELKFYDLTIIQPPEVLGSPLDFDRGRLDRLYKMGREAAKQAL